MSILTKAQARSRTDVTPAEISASALSAADLLAQMQATPLSFDDVRAIVDDLALGVEMDAATQAAQAHAQADAEQAQEAWSVATVAWREAARNWTEPQERLATLQREQERLDAERQEIAGRLQEAEDLQHLVDGVRLETDQDWDPQLRATEERLAAVTRELAALGPLVALVERLAATAPWRPLLSEVRLTPAQERVVALQGEQERLAEERQDIVRHIQEAQEVAGLLEGLRRRLTGAPDWMAQRQAIEARSAVVARELAPLRPVVERAQAAAQQAREVMTVAAARARAAVGAMLPTDLRSRLQRGETFTLIDALHGSLDGAAWTVWLGAGVSDGDRGVDVYRIASWYDYAVRPSAELLERRERTARVREGLPRLGRADGALPFAEMRASLARCSSPRDQGERRGLPLTAIRLTFIERPPDLTPHYRLTLTQGIGSGRVPHIEQVARYTSFMQALGGQSVPPAPDVPRRPSRAALLGETAAQA